MSRCLLLADDERENGIQSILYGLSHSCLLHWDGLWTDELHDLWWSIRIYAQSVQKFLQKKKKKKMEEITHPIFL